MHRGVGSDGWGKAQWLGVQEGKSTIFGGGGGGGGSAFIFQPDGLTRTICKVEIADNMTIKRRMTVFGLKRLGDGVASSVFQGMFVEISAGGGFRHSDFETRPTKAIEPPGPRQQRHENQTMAERVGALVARGVCMGGRSDLPFLPCCCHGYIMSGVRRLEGLF